MIGLAWEILSWNWRCPVIKSRWIGCFYYFYTSSRSCLQCYRHRGKRNLCSRNFWLLLAVRVWKTTFFEPFWTGASSLFLSLPSHLACLKETFKLSTYWRLFPLFLTLPLKFCFLYRWSLIFCPVDLCLKIPGGCWVCPLCSWKTLRGDFFPLLIF